MSKLTPEELIARLDPGRMRAGQRGLVQRIVLLVERNTKKEAPVKKGRLRRSINGRMLSDTQGAVGTNLVYAKRIHEGSKEIKVVPRNRKALRFMVGDRVVFAKRVTQPARTGNPFLERGLTVSRGGIQSLLAQTGAEFWAGKTR